jgi:hypothetical protein
MPSLTFAVPEVEMELSDTEVESLAAELEDLDSTPLGPGARDLHARISGGQRIEVQSITFAEFWALLRALDHLRNADALDREGQRLRDALVAGWIPYRLRRFGGPEELDFTSYAGLYVASDRLVRSSGEVYRVVDVVVSEDEPTLLVVDEWRSPLYD